MSVHFRPNLPPLSSIPLLPVASDPNRKAAEKKKTEVSLNESSIPTGLLQSPQVIQPVKTQGPSEADAARKALFPDAPKSFGVSVKRLVIQDAQFTTANLMGSNAIMLNRNELIADPTAPQMAVNNWMAITAAENTPIRFGITIENNTIVALHPIEVDPGNPIRLMPGDRKYDEKTAAKTLNFVTGAVPDKATEIPMVLTDKIAKAILPILHIWELKFKPANEQGEIVADPDSGQFVLSMRNISGEKVVGFRFPGQTERFFISNRDPGVMINHLARGGIPFFKIPGVFESGLFTLKNLSLDHMLNPKPGVTPHAMDLQKLFTIPEEVLARFKAGGVSITPFPAEAFSDPNLFAKEALTRWAKSGSFPLSTTINIDMLDAATGLQVVGQMHYDGDAKLLRAPRENWEKAFANLNDPTAKVIANPARYPEIVDVPYYHSSPKDGADAPALRAPLLVIESDASLPDVKSGKLPTVSFKIEDSKMSCEIFAATGKEGPFLDPGLSITNSRVSTGAITGEIRNVNLNLGSTEKPNVVTRIALSMPKGVALNTDRLMIGHNAYVDFIAKGQTIPAEWLPDASGKILAQANGTIAHLPELQLTLQTSTGQTISLSARDVYFKPDFSRLLLLDGKVSEQMLLKYILENALGLDNIVQKPEIQDFLVQLLKGIDLRDHALTAGEAKVTYEDSDNKLSVTSRNTNLAYSLSNLKASAVKLPGATSVGEVSVALESKTFGSWSGSATLIDLDGALTFRTTTKTGASQFSGLGVTAKAQTEVQVGAVADEDIGLKIQSLYENIRAGFSFDQDTGVLSLDPDIGLTFQNTIFKNEKQVGVARGTVRSRSETNTPLSFDTRNTNLLTTDQFVLESNAEATFVFGNDHQFEIQAKVPASIVSLRQLKANPGLLPSDLFFSPGMDENSLTLTPLAFTGEIDWNTPGLTLTVVDKSGKTPKNLFDIRLSSRTQMMGEEGGRKVTVKAGVSDVELKTETQGLEAGFALTEASVTAVVQNLAQFLRDSSSTDISGSFEVKLAGGKAYTAMVRAADGIKDILPAKEMEQVLAEYATVLPKFVQDILRGEKFEYQASLSTPFAISGKFKANQAGIEQSELQTSALPEIQHSGTIGKGDSETRISGSTRLTKLANPVLELTGLDALLKNKTGTLGLNYISSLGTSTTLTLVDASGQEVTLKSGFDLETAINNGEVQVMRDADGFLTITKEGTTVALGGDRKFHVDLGQEITQMLEAEKIGVNFRIKDLSVASLSTIELYAPPKAAGEQGQWISARLPSDTRVSNFSATQDGVDGRLSLSGTGLNFVAILGKTVDGSAAPKDLDLNTLFDVVHISIDEYKEELGFGNSATGTITSTAKGVSIRGLHENDAWGSQKFAIDSIDELKTEIQLNQVAEFVEQINQDVHLLGLTQAIKQNYQKLKGGFKTTLVSAQDPRKAYNVYIKLSQGALPLELGAALLGNEMEGTFNPETGVLMRVNRSKNSPIDLAIKTGHPGDTRIDTRRLNPVEMADSIDVLTDGRVKVKFDANTVTQFYNAEITQTAADQPIYDFTYGQKVARAVENNVAHLFIERGHRPPEYRDLMFYSGNKPTENFVILEKGLSAAAMGKMEVDVNATPNIDALIRVMCVLELQGASKPLLTAGAPRVVTLEDLASMPRYFELSPEKRKVVLDRIGLLGFHRSKLSVEAQREKIAQLVFRNPEAGQLEAGARFLDYLMDKVVHADVAPMTENPVRNVETGYRGDIFPVINALPLAIRKARIELNIDPSKAKERDISKLTRGSIIDLDMDLYMGQDTAVFNVAKAKTAYMPGLVQRVRIRMGVDENGIAKPDEGMVYIQFGVLEQNFPSTRLQDSDPLVRLNFDKVANIFKVYSLDTSSGVRAEVEQGSFMAYILRTVYGRSEVKGFGVNAARDVGYRAFSVGQNDDGGAELFNIPHIMSFGAMPKYTDFNGAYAYKDVPVPGLSSLLNIFASQLDEANMGLTVNFGDLFALAGVAPMTGLTDPTMNGELVFTDPTTEKEVRLQVLKGNIYLPKDQGGAILGKENLFGMDKHGWCRFVYKNKWNHFQTFLTGEENSIGWKFVREK